jgi:hypothetical protein
MVVNGGKSNICKVSIGSNSNVLAFFGLYFWVCVIFFARVVVSEHLRRACRGVRGGADIFSPVSG